MGLAARALMTDLSNFPRDLGGRNREGNGGLSRSDDHGEVMYFINTLILSFVVTGSPTPTRAGGAHQIHSSLTKSTIEPVLSWEAGISG